MNRSFDLSKFNIQSFLNCGELLKNLQMKRMYFKRKCFQIGALLLVCLMLGTPDKGWTYTHKNPGEKSTKENPHSVPINPLPYLPKEEDTPISFVRIPDFVLSMESRKESIDIEGKVINEEGEELIGVNVLVKGTDKGTATDFMVIFIWKMWMRMRSLFYHMWDTRQSKSR